MTVDPTATGVTRGADDLLRILNGWGVGHVFICPGSTEAAFLTAVAAQDDIELVLTTHESVAVAMADGLARETARPAVAYLHANVGLTNGLSHLAAARLAYSPVVLLTGLKQLAIQNRGGFTTAPHMRDFVRQYTKWDWQTRASWAVAEDVNRALRLAAAAPAGPTWVGLAQDVVEGPGADSLPEPRRFDVRARRRPLPEDVSAAADLLARAERVVIVAGAQCAPDGVSTLLELADRLGAVVLGEDRRTVERTVVPFDHSAYVGMYDHSRQSVRDADVLFLAGTRSPMEFEAPTGPALPPGLPVIHLHSDPDEVGKVYGVDVPLVGEAAETLEELVAALPACSASSVAEVARATAGREHRAQRDQILPASGDEGNGLTVPDAIRALAATLDEDTTVVGDATTSGGTLLHGMELAPRARFHTSASGSLGWGAGFALGVQLADPARRVVAVLGDGAFQFGIQALWTAVRYQVPVVFLVVNNRSYAAVGAAIRRYSGGLTERERRATVDLSGPDIAAVSQGFGAAAERVDTVDGVRRAIEAARHQTVPTVVEVLTDPQELGP